MFAIAPKFQCIDNLFLNVCSLFKLSFALLPLQYFTFISFFHKNSWRFIHKILFFEICLGEKF